MVKKTAVIVLLPLFVSTLFGLTGWPFHSDLVFLSLPIIISLVIVFKFGTVDAAKCIGLFTLKPMFNLLLNDVSGVLVFQKELDSVFPYNIVRSVIWAVPELILTLIIVYRFRHLFSKERVLLIFLVGDIIRWVSVFISLWFPDPIPEPYFYWQLYIAVFFIGLFPFMYAIAGFIFIKEQISSNTVAY